VERAHLVLEVRALLPLLVALVLLIALERPAAVLAQAQPAPALGRDQVVIGLSESGEPASIGKLFTTNTTVEDAFEALIFTVNVQRDAAWKPFPQGVETLPNIKDGTWRLDGEQMVLTWRIRPRRWHDGRPVTCGDYVFGHQLARDDRLPIHAPLRIQTRRLLGVTCPKGASGVEIQVRWKERFALANLAITPVGAVPRHVLEPLYRRAPARLSETFGVDPRLTVGDGPYRLVEWRKGQSMVFEAVPNHGIFGSPRIRRITYRFAPAEELISALLSGTIDAIPVVAIRFAQELRREARIKLIREEGLLWEHIDFNLDNPLLQDVRVRRAIAHGINRTQIVQQLFQGLQPVSHTYLPRKHPAYTDAVPRYPYDPARARALLVEAGFSPGLDGVLQNAAGVRLSLEFSTTAGFRAREDIQRIIQQQLRQVGIEITIVNFPVRVFFSEIIDRRRFKALSMYTWVLGPGSGCRNLYTSGAIPSEANGWEGGNFPGYRNPEMDRLCEEAEGEIDETRRHRLLRETMIIFSRDLPALPLYSRVIIAAAKVGLENFTAYPLATGFEAWNAHTWYWK